MTLGDFAAPEFERRRELLEKALLQAMAAPEVEAVHKVRTSWRRLEAAVKLLPWLTPKPRWEDFRLRMKSVMKASAELRDRDNALIRLKGIEALCLTMEGQRRLWEPEFHRRAEAMFPYSLPMRERFPAEALQDAATKAERIIEDLEMKTAAERSRLGPGSKTEEWHRFRILTKRERYSLEFFSGLNDEYAKRAEFIKERQDTLGAVEDVVAAVRVARAAAPAKRLIREALEFLEMELRHKVEALGVME
jgi:CHAD domain-containing protein